MCEPTESESGQLLTIKPCGWYLKITSDRDRLTGVVQGMEEQNSRNLEALRRAEAENKRLRDEIERQSPYRIRLHNDLLGSQALVEEVLADNKNMREALKSIRTKTDDFAGDGRMMSECIDYVFEVADNALKEVG